MKAKKYRIMVCEGLMDHIHGGGHEIDEVYVPELNLFINPEGTFVNQDAVATRLQEVKALEDIEVDAELASQLAAAIATKTDLEAKLRTALSLTKE